MKSITALLENDDMATRSCQRLKEAGLGEDRINIITEENSIRKLLNCEPMCVVARFALRGAILGVAVYALFAVFAGLCQCDLFHFGQAYGVGTFLGGILAGVFVGGGLGSLVGAAQFEQDSHVYIQGVRMGGRVILIQTQDAETDLVKRILEEERAFDVKML
jgi:hypothetical protein